MKTKISRRFAESRPVCVGLYGRQGKWNRSQRSSLPDIFESGSSVGFFVSSKQKERYFTRKRSSGKTKVCKSHGESLQKPRALIIGPSK